MWEIFLPQFPKMTNNNIKLILEKKNKQKKRQKREYMYSNTENQFPISAKEESHKSTFVLRLKL